MLVTVLFPDIECFAVFNLAAGQPVVFFWRTAFPPDEVLVASSALALVDNAVDIHLLDAVLSDHGWGPSEMAVREQGRVILKIRLEF